MAEKMMKGKKNRNGEKDGINNDKCDVNVRCSEGTRGLASANTFFT